MASVQAENLGVRFFFDRQRRVITAGLAKLTPWSTSIWGLKGVTLEIGPGEGVALIGPTGAGKTTLLQAIAGIMPADAGRIETMGRVGSMLATDAGLMPTLTGRENAFLLSVLAGLSRSQAKASLKHIKAASELGDAFERPASSLSQGMRARLALTAAQEAGPEILLLDEVHEALDHAFRSRLAKTSREAMRAGGIVIAAGHDHEILSQLCDRAILLDSGGVQVDGPFERVRENYIGSIPAE